MTYFAFMIIDLSIWKCFIFKQKWLKRRENRVSVTSRAILYINAKAQQKVEKQANTKAKLKSAQQKLLYLFLF